MKTILMIALLVMSSTSFARNIFLNGKDISSARAQKLDKVNVFISENGDIFISAPQYQVFEEKTFVPLAKAKPKRSHISRHPANLPSITSSPASENIPAPSNGYTPGSELEKAGSKKLD